MSAQYLSDYSITQKRKNAIVRKIILPNSHIFIKKRGGFSLLSPTPKIYQGRRFAAVALSKLREIMAEI